MGITVFPFSLNAKACLVNAYRITERQITKRALCFNDPGQHLIYRFRFFNVNKNLLLEIFNIKFYTLVISTEFRLSYVFLSVQKHSLSQSSFDSWMFRFFVTRWRLKLYVGKKRSFCFLFDFKLFEVVCAWGTRYNLRYCD